MPRLAPIHYKKFEKFLETQGCYYVSTEGDHRKWRKQGLPRPIIVRKLKDLPVFEIRNNLRTLGISVEAYLEIIKDL